MFEVGFSEILLIMVIALVVLGPEKLPKLATDLGRWMGRARAMARQLRTQLDQEIQLEELLREQKRAAGTDATGTTLRAGADTPPGQPAVAPDAPPIGAPSDEMHSHGPAARGVATATAPAAAPAAAPVAAPAAVPGAAPAAAAAPAAGAAVPTPGDDGRR